MIGKGSHGYGYPTQETAQAASRLRATEYCVKSIDNDELE